MSLYFTYKSRGTLKSFNLFITVETITKLNLGHIDKFEIKNLKSELLWFTFSRQRRIWSFRIVVFQRTAKKCTKNYNARAQPLFSSLNLLFSDVAVAVTVMVFLSSLLCREQGANPDSAQTMAYRERQDSQKPVVKDCMNTDRDLRKCEWK